jgi:hypothetical protein
MMTPMGIRCCGQNPMAILVAICTGSSVIMSTTTKKGPAHTNSTFADPISTVVAMEKTSITEEDDGR